ncbi:twin-arginine translocase subunit TatB [Seongchinamella unica]|uniref:Sec-independent protein translocase protein TatB n=1 Tax=Seongchinamella unica TaxID=2547392 RepID=A0A4R5LVV4_9GAMM|nr:Sec-independent protein translocase protein TatB [Seongchinamella unica]TDG15594.1 twin-arginine translocase subunit TatB [Seongchinamella unica]
MFDIGFAELIVIAIVGLLVVGPERLPGAIRTGSAWLGRIKRGFNDIKREVQQELHNDAVMQELKSTQQQLRDETAALQEQVRGVVEEASPLPETKKRPEASASDDKTTP